jgi:hypothetical protein
MSINRVIDLNSLPKAAHALIAPDGYYYADDLVHHGSVDSLEIALAFRATISDLLLIMKFSGRHVRGCLQC